MEGEAGMEDVGGRAVFAGLGTRPSWGTAPGTTPPEAGGPTCCVKRRVSPEEQA